MPAAFDPGASDSGNSGRESGGVRSTKTPASAPRTPAASGAKQSDLPVAGQHDAPGVDGPATGQVAPRRAPAPPRELPLFSVLLHNDDVNDMLYVIRSVTSLTGYPPNRSIEITLEAHNTGVSKVLSTHLERAELFVEQFTSLGLTATCQPEA